MCIKWSFMWIKWSFMWIKWSFMWIKWFNIQLDHSTFLSYIVPFMIPSPPPTLSVSAPPLPLSLYAAVAPLSWTSGGGRGCPAHPANQCPPRSGGLLSWVGQRQTQRPCCGTLLWWDCGHSTRQTTAETTRARFCGTSAARGLVGHELNHGVHWACSSQNTDLHPVCSCPGWHEIRR